MTLPWDDTNHDVLGDLVAAVNCHHAHPWGTFSDWSQVMSPTSDSVAVVSGGLDSTTLVYHMISEGYTPHLLTFDYGQRHRRQELTYARMLAQRLQLPFDRIDLIGISRLISNSALTDASIEVPEGHYTEDSMKRTVVPNRNMIMLSIAAGLAVNNGYRTIGFGAHAGDHFIYPDCRPQFIENVGWAILSGNEDLHSFVTPTQAEPDEYRFYAPIYAPFLFKNKADIVYRALELKVPLHLTWSCYKGGSKHCGRCGTCVERLEAIDTALLTYRQEHPDKTVEDHTEYEDTEYWKIVTQGEHS